MRSGEVAKVGAGAIKARMRSGPKIQWQHFYVSGDKTFCVYLAESADEIRKHSELSGIPVARVTEIATIIDPLTANN